LEPELRPNLEHTIKLFDEYYRHQDKVNASFNKDLACEARKRLVQLGKILGRVFMLEREAERLELSRGMHQAGEDPMVDKIVRRISEITDELEFLTEAFYYFAFRLRRILKVLPGLAGFECEGIRDVRNKLIEHPEQRDSNVYILSFGHGGIQGPVIKALRHDNQSDVFVDRGLFVNAIELTKSLEKRLADYLRSRSSDN
jgi:hypothetical protein